MLWSAVKGGPEFMAAFAANSPCLAGVCCQEVQLHGVSWWGAVSEPCRNLLAPAAGQHAQNASLPRLVGREAVAAEEGDALFRAACLEEPGGLGLLGGVCHGTAGWPQTLSVSHREGPAGPEPTAAQARAMVVEGVREVLPGLHCEF